MFSIHCPHCQKELRLTNDRANPTIRCSEGAMRSCKLLPRKKPAESKAYTLKTNEERHDSPSNVRIRRTSDQESRKGAEAKARQP